MYLLARVKNGRTVANEDCVLVAAAAEIEIKLQVFRTFLNGQNTAGCRHG